MKETKNNLECFSGSTLKTWKLQRIKDLFESLISPITFIMIVVSVLITFGNLLIASVAWLGYFEGGNPFQFFALWYWIGETVSMIVTVYLLQRDYVACGILNTFHDVLDEETKSYRRQNRELQICVLCFVPATALVAVSALMLCSSG
jgi:hypothetical protein